MTEFIETGSIQYDTIATTGTYAITADGAQGGNFKSYTYFEPGGKGAAVTGDIVLTQGTVLEIVVGGAGVNGPNGGGGGGGSFVFETLSSGTLDLVVVAGGGGGGGQGASGGGGATGTSGQNGGTLGTNFKGGAGGISGGAGGAGGSGGGGGGYTGGKAGSSGQTQPKNPTFKGAAGASTLGVTHGGGGFGGGGAAGGFAGGGGGGYNGGGAGGREEEGGGGGSYDADLTNVTASPGTNPGNGLVDIIFTAAAPCYLRGTGIRTPAGDVPVESLKEGDLVALADGGFSPVVWLGRRKLDCARHPNPQSVWPVLVREGAFADGVPARDLYLSPGHAVFVAGVLMQAEKLINGATILQVETELVEYWHVELKNHAILLAENLPAESYLDQGNRPAFVNGGAFVETHPEFLPKQWAETCVKLVFEGPEMAAAKDALLARAKLLGHASTQDDDVHIIADGKRFEPVGLGASRLAFMLPAGSEKISLHSRSFVPAHASPVSRDKRSLGIRIRGLQLDGADIALDDETAFGAGWHKHEPKDGTPGARWTSGPAPIPANTRLIMLERAGAGTYWVSPKAAGNKVVALFG
jgi:hypothetical protein